MQVVYEEQQPDIDVSRSIMGNMRQLAGSGFAIVINTNKIPKSREDEMWRRVDLMHAMKTLQRTRSQYASLFNFLTPYDTDTFNNRTIAKIIFSHPTTEVGTKNRRVHGNMVIQVSHYSKIHIDRNMLKQHMLANLHDKSIRNLHINIRAFNANRDTLMRYNNKERDSALGQEMFSHVESFMSTGQIPEGAF